MWIEADVAAETLSSKIWPTHAHSIPVQIGFKRRLTSMFNGRKPTLRIVHTCYAYDEDGNLKAFRGKRAASLPFLVGSVAIRK